MYKIYSQTQHAYHFPKRFQGQNRMLKRGQWNKCIDLPESYLVLQNTGINHFCLNRHIRQSYHKWLSKNIWTNDKANAFHTKDRRPVATFFRKFFYIKIFKWSWQKCLRMIICQTKFQVNKWNIHTNLQINQATFPLIH